MQFSIDKKTVIGIVGVIGALLILIFAHGLSTSAPKAQEIKSTSQQSNKVDLVSTNPANLDNSTISPNQTIQLTFNSPIDEQYQKFQISLDPNIDYQTQLTDDKKTLTITPDKGFGFGQGYTLTIKSGNKFLNGQTLDHDITIHFTTTQYSGV